MEHRTPFCRTAFFKSLLEVVQTLVIAVALYALITTFVGRYEVLNISMEPTFHQGQRILVDRAERLLPYWLTHTAHANTGQSGDEPILRRGQIAVFYPDDSHQETPLIKRVIALPGDHVSIRANQVTVNGQTLTEPYIHGLPTTCTRYCDLTLAPSQYFVLGDNRTNSYDSRSFGPVKEENVIGQVVLRYWPLDKIEMYP